MSTDQYSTTQKALSLAILLVTLSALTVTGLLLREHGPGNMGTGFLQGAAVGALGVCVVAWRVGRRPDSTTTFERAWTRTGDERDDAVLTRALAVLGLASVPLTCATVVALGFGAPVEVVVGLLLLAEITVGTVAFVVISRRS
ncbi:hypothetical protein [Oerskovia flava]|uniref:hypothetical protein n=1 Tax=Oerskovia flava TaxID=2986422 RepID=UPI0022408770|nr:hypothetical protein [Oerskovia sp. JB1-3-2]